MDEREALRALAGTVPEAGDDAAVVDGLAVTTDMLHRSTDFPAGTTQYTAGWRAVAASLSDIAAMGADPVAAVAAYAETSLDWGEIEAFVRGAKAVCTEVGGEYVGGDLDDHEELTVTSTVVGRADRPVFRSGATPGEAVCVTGTLGRSAAALELFERGETERANELFRFTPRVEAGRTLAGRAGAMMDSSDGLARSLHQLAEASDCGFAIESPLPVDTTVEEIADTAEQRREMGAFFGEDFELVCTVPEEALERLREELSVGLTKIGRVVESGVTLDGEPLPDRGYTHG
ncbi:thiamine-phosphate kinase [Halovenus sp. WSH3]|uniref:Thiamine-monophosphate kinase n=1 Tax=Halovenus carboxidivorans TaxID=2692199 RepID=A0A6B0T0W2_9EURY|nr:thiamine-phosphate kinase [Halovenus carboxidivorans]MXR51828.1 thiamine-phosphate kinase [Halovenus carboxidivorans]